MNEALLFYLLGLVTLPMLFCLGFSAFALVVIAKALRQKMKEEPKDE